MNIYDIDGYCYQYDTALKNLGKHKRYNDLPCLDIYGLEDWLNRKDI